MKPKLKDSLLAVTLACALLPGCCALQSSSLDRAIAVAKAEAREHVHWKSPEVVIVRNFVDRWEITLSPDLDSMRHAVIHVGKDGKVIRTETGW